MGTKRNNDQHFNYMPTNTQWVVKHIGFLRNDNLHYYAKGSISILFSLFSVARIVVSVGINAFQIERVG